MKKMIVLFFAFIGTGLALAQTNAPSKAAIAAKMRADVQLLVNWPQLSRYRFENATVPAPAPDEARVVFMGDSITDRWGREQGSFFPGKPYINRGISGQITGQMLVRFRPDVLALKPRVVIILAGINDIGDNVVLSVIEDNLTSMAELARANNVKVVLASIMPVNGYIYPDMVSSHPSEKILAVNAWIKSYAKREHFVYLDYYPTLLDSHQQLKKEFSNDGLHPNTAGYAVMAPLAQQAIEKAPNALTLTGSAAMTEAYDPARRAILKYGALTAAGFSMFRGRFANATVIAKHPLNELGYRQVQFSPGPLERQARENHSLVLNLDEDALLRPFRLRAGKPAPGQELGGWYNTDGFAPGATFGQWLSSLSRYYAITGDPATRAKVARLVRGYAATVDADGAFYRHNRFPSYTYDKLVGGLIDAHSLANDRVALATLQQTTRAAVAYLPPHAIPRNEASKPNEDFTQHAWDESYTLPENQFLAFRATGDAQHRVLAKRFLYDDFFRPLANGDNVLPGKHAYSHVNALSSAAQAYLSLGQPMYLQAAMRGLAMIEAQSFATGGWGPDEHFVVPGRGSLAASLDTQHKSFETPCGAYAHIKLTRYLLRITRDARYGDSMERVLYNTVLGAKPIQPDGQAFYYSDYTRRAQKAFYDTPWPCCSGTLPMVAADYRISAFFTDAHGIYVNLYVPGTVNWRQGNGVAMLTVSTQYPHASTITMDVQTSIPQTFTINLRIPGWTRGASLRINGKRIMEPATSGTFAAIRRQWRHHDRIELELPLSLRVESVDTEHPDTLALLAGPLVLMHILDTTASKSITRRALLSAKSSLGDAYQWEINAGNETVKLRPFIAIDQQTYSVYQDVLPA